jgi:hypothetical protein
MLISKQRKFIFIHVYKTAGWSMTDALIPFAASRWWRRADWVSRKFGITYFNLRPFPCHISAPDLIKKIGRDVFDSYFSFAIVRNPWDWQVSLYKFMLKDQSHPQHDLAKSFKDFDEYIRWRCANEVRFQKDFIYSQDGELLVDFVGRFENIDADFKAICSRIGISTSLPKVNVSNSIPYRQYYNSETRELVRRAFDTDIKLFGYDF